MKGKFERTRPGRAQQVSLLIAGARSGDVLLAAQLAGCPPCPVCDFALPACRCVDNGACKFAGGGAPCISHCGDPICLKAKS